jgi:opacity protein-like surface antigen
VREIPNTNQAKENQMKKRMLFAVAAAVLVCGAAAAQDAKPGEQTKTAATGAKEMSKKAVTINGTVSVDGLTLVSDKDKKTYKVVNPEFTKENAGQHVRVSARVSKDNTEIQVSSVMVQEEPLVANKGDSAFRR